MALFCIFVNRWQPWSTLIASAVELLFKTSNGFMGKGEERYVEYHGTMTLLGCWANFEEIEHQHHWLWRGHLDEVSVCVDNLLECQIGQANSQDQPSN